MILRKKILMKIFAICSLKTLWPPACWHMGRAARSGILASSMPLTELTLPLPGTDSEWGICSESLMPRIPLVPTAILMCCLIGDC